jgi:hypothetical protein
VITHPHTRSDFPQTYSPRIPRPVACHRRLTCTPEIERRIRELLTWHAGTVGLISDRALDLIVELHLSDHVSLRDLRILASDRIYQVIRDCVMAMLKSGRKQTKGV